jgi:hypothetical protein
MPRTAKSVYDKRIEVLFEYLELKKIISQKDNYNLRAKELIKILKSAKSANSNFLKYLESTIKQEDDKNDPEYIPPKYLLDDIPPKEHLTRLKASEGKKRVDYKEPETDEDDDPDDWVLPKNYLGSLTDGISENLLTDNIVYMIRIWIRICNKYFYKIGFTNNVKKRLVQLNSEFEACGRIIIVMLTKVECNKSELDFHTKYKKYAIEDVKIKFTKKKEIYPPTAEMYDRFKNYIEKNEYVTGEPYDTDKYTIDDSNYETLDDGTVLDQGKEEQSYWHNKIWGLC